MAKGDQDSKIVHKETLDREDEIFAALDKRFGSLNIKLPKPEDTKEEEKPKGFTLIELLVVIAIVGIMAAIAIPQYGAYRQRAIDVQVKSDLKSAITAQEAYFVDHNRYAESVSGLVTAGFRQSANVKVEVTGSQTEFSITAQALTGCSEGTGKWTFSNAGDGRMNGRPCG